MFIKELINAKIKQLTSSDLMKYSEEYDISLSEHEAEQIISYYQQNDINPFDVEERMQFFKQLGVITDQQTAQKAHELFVEMIRQYNLAHLFE